MVPADEVGWVCAAEKSLTSHYGYNMGRRPLVAAFMTLREETRNG
jgi:hypothetical protein